MRIILKYKENGKIHTFLLCYGGIILKQIIENSKELITVDKIVQALKDIGIKKGSTVIVHTKLSSLGFVCSGEIAIIEALMKVVTKEGTIVMPTQTGDLSEPAFWENPKVPQEWWDDIRSEMIPFDKEKTPTLGMGKVPEAFRKYPDVVRSNHPTVSFAAWGKHSNEVVKEHSLSFALYEESPLHVLQKLDADIVMIGTTYETTTSLHYAEYTRQYPILITQGSPVIINGKRQWVTYKEIPFNTDEFNEIGNDFEKENEIESVELGNSTIKKVSQRKLIKFAEEWYLKKDKVK